MATQSEGQMTDNKQNYKPFKNLVAIQCTFLLDTKSTYQYLYQFEYALNDFFSERGMNLESVKTVKGNTVGEMYLITKKQEIKIPALPDQKKAPQPLTNQQKILQKRK